MNIINFTEAVQMLQMNMSYTTPFRCTNGSYALISGKKFTFEFNYGHRFSEVRMTLAIVQSYSAHLVIQQD